MFSYKRIAGSLKHLMVAVLFVLTIFTTSGAALLTPRAAQAQFTTFDINQAATWVWEKVQSAADWAWKHGAAVAFKNAARTFTTQIAYDTASKIASGDLGQNPLQWIDSIGKSARNAYDDTAGDFVESFGQEFLRTTQNDIFGGVCRGGSKNGESCSSSADCGGGSCDMTANEANYLQFNVCEPSGPGGPTAKLVIGYTLINEIKPRKPKCTLSTMAKNWDKLREEMRRGNLKDYLKKFAYFDAKQNDLGVGLSLQSNLLTRANEAKVNAQIERMVGKGYKDVVTAITGAIKTPAGDISNLQQSSLEASQQDFNAYTGDIVADALGVFTNTLASKLIKKLIEGSIPEPDRYALGGRKFTLEGQGRGGVEYASQINSSIATPQLVGGDILDVIGELSNCPQDQSYATQNNCTINEKFAQVLRKAQQGSALTLQEAIDQGYINSGWKFGDRRGGEIRTPVDTWYLSDLKKLRRARIIPVGWELVAEKFPGTTLQQVVGNKASNYSDGFNGVGVDGRCGTTDDSSQYCGLIDPNWVLRAPPEQCRIQAYGQLLESEGANRQKTCVDVQHCVAEREDGSCQAWGYCTQEKNIWRFSGESCEFPEGSGFSPYATCQAFTNSNDEEVAYLTNSLSNYSGYGDSTCSGVIGCRWYGTSFDPNLTSNDPARYSVTGTQAKVNTQDFITQASSAEPRLYLRNLDSQVYQCNSQSEGCRQFFRLRDISSSVLDPNSTLNPVAQVVSRVSVTAGETYNSYAKVEPLNLREAPPYLGVCRDADPRNDKPECKNYLSICQASEVGCELYGPSDGSPAVPAQISPENVCPGECVGLNTYQQVGTFFEKTPAQPQANFIPNSAQKCSAESVGCEEFTNLEAGEALEYYSDLRQCIKPGEGDHTYYTWVGSDLTGYQLKTWQLKAVGSEPSSAPATTDNSGSGPACGSAGQTDWQNANSSTSPDCKQFYDVTGNIHYRYAAKTITASAACITLRRTGGTQADCLASNDDANAWHDNACFYRAIPSEGKKCNANQAACREFRGPTANNVKLVFPISTFGDKEAGTSVDTSPLGGWEGGTNSNESVSAFGHSLRSSSEGVVSKHVTYKFSAGRQYSFSFWLKHTTEDKDITVKLKGTSSGSEVILGVIPSAATDWHLYSLGPLDVNLSEAEVDLIISTEGGMTALLPDALSDSLLDKLSLLPRPALAAVSPRFNIDNVALREVTDTFFVRKGSWVTPSSCIGTGSTADPQYLRCAAYTGRNNQRYTLTGFANLCRAEAVGCEALVDTKNSTLPQSSSFTVADQTVTVPADSVVYRVYDAKKTCSAQNKACLRLGVPKFKQSGEVVSWSDKFARVDPNTFSTDSPQSPLCGRSQNACEEYKDEQGASYAFKDPGEQVCEYKLVNPGVGYNWYQKGTDEPCNLVNNQSFEKFGPIADVPNSGEIDDQTADSFVSWRTKYNPPETLRALSSRNGKYWGGTVLEVRSVARQYSGVYQTIELVPKKEVRTVTVSADIYIPQGESFGPEIWMLETTATPEGGCRPRGGNPGANCHHYDHLTPWEGRLIYEQDPPNTWIRRSTTIRLDPGVKYLDVHIQTNIGNDPGMWKVSSVYVDNFQVIEQSSGNWAYACPGNMSSCKAFRDPVLTKQTYYYLDNKKLDRSSCAGGVSEKEGCLMFNDLSKLNPGWNAQETYDLSRSQDNRRVAPTIKSGKCSNNLARLCTKENELADCGTGVCDAPTTNRCSNDTSKICGAAIDCVAEPKPTCAAPVNNRCSNNLSQSCNSKLDCVSPAPSCDPYMVGTCSNTGDRCDMDSDCTIINLSESGQIKIAGTQVKIAGTEGCYETSAICQNNCEGGTCHNNPTDCGTDTPYLCRNATPTTGTCNKSTNYRCSNSGAACASTSDDESCVTGVTCGPTTNTFCSNSPSTACSEPINCVTNPPTCTTTTNKYCSNKPTIGCGFDSDCTNSCSVGAGGTADANTILKVRRDRVCSEWLACKSEVPRLNPQKGQFESICYALGRCSSWGGSGAQGSAKCGRWLDDEASPSPLTVPFYQNRGVPVVGGGPPVISWSSKEYSGYSIPGMYPISSLTVKDYADYNQANSKADLKLTRLMKICSNANGNKPGEGGTATRAWKECLSDSNCSDQSPFVYCRGIYDVGVNGSGNNPVKLAKLCRAYPKADAPFPYQLASWKKSCEGTACGTKETEQVIASKESGFTSANLCQDGKECECSYEQATYTGGEILFYGSKTETAYQFYVGDKATEADDITKTRLKRLDSMLGVKGYCLERDSSRIINAGKTSDPQACLTWMPLDVVAGESSLYDYSPNAGFVSPQPSPLYYCLEASYIELANPRYFCVDGGSGSCTKVVKADEPTAALAAAPSSDDYFKTGESTGPSLQSCISSPGFDHPRVDIAKVKLYYAKGQVYEWKTNYYTESSSCEGGCPTNYSSCPTGTYNTCRDNRDKCTTVDGDDQWCTANSCSGNKHNSSLGALEPTSSWSEAYGAFGCDSLAKVYDSVTSQDEQGVWTDRAIRLNSVQMSSNGSQLLKDRVAEPFGVTAAPSGTPSSWSLPLGRLPKPMCFVTPNLVETDGTTQKCATGQVVPPSNAGLGVPFTYPAASFRGTSYNASTRTDAAQIFARASTVYGWDNGSGSYSTNQSARSWDLRGSTQGSLGTTGGVGVPAAPQVKAVCFNNAGQTEECSGNGFTIRTEAGSVNSQSTSNVDILSGSAVSILFYAYNPNGEQMPLREVRVDWVGNQLSGDQAGSDGKYKNRKHICLASTDPNYTFGDSPNACIGDTPQQPAYFVFTRVYTCSIGGTGYDSNKGYCEFNPKVYVKDNWDWCTGNNSSGAWGNSSGCNISSAAAWLPFNGKIIVRP